MNYKNILINIIIVFFSIIFALILVELFLRINNQGPWGTLDHKRNDPTLNKPDPKLGWVPKEGKYSFNAFSPEGNKFEINILPDSSRKVSFYKKDNKEKEQIIFLGGSVTLGWGVNDEQTFISQLQKRTKNYKIKNYSAGGYGTYQSYLRLEEILKVNNKIKTVIISFLPDHEIRNIGSEFWLRTLSKHSRRGYVSLPYASINEKGDLLRKDPITYFRMPLMNHLSVANKVSKKIMQSRLKGNEKNATIVTKAIFESTKDLLENKNIELVVLSLAENSKDLIPYIKIFEKKGINYINCNIKQTEDLTIKGDGHPNQKMHFLYSECIDQKLKKLLIK
jgi:hypothetical protein|tara:strand:+ start:63 stop:1070 length:1008 start_codon:yes stop_codon:yes gene_type:complete